MKSRSDTKVHNPPPLDYINASIHTSNAAPWLIVKLIAYFSHGCCGAPGLVCFGLPSRACRRHAVCAV